MNHLELIERLRLLSISGRAIDTALIAPGLPGKSAYFVSLLSNDKEIQQNAESIVTCQDLREFLDWLTPIIAHENKRQELLRNAQFSDPGHTD